MRIAFDPRLDGGGLARARCPGRGGAPFRLVRFHRVTDELGPDCGLLPGAGRVGPRLLLMDYLPLYTPERARRHEVRPGITGWARANGRDAITWVEKFALDDWYMDRRSLRLDVASFWRTLLRRHGIAAAGEPTMLRCTGSGGC